MPYDYDKLYSETANALGEPTKMIVDFFERNGPENTRILDVGCGQGRDALFLARRGHRVVGVDLSPNGIRDLQTVAENENLAIEGVVADISSFEPDGTFDVLLIDRTLHMLAEDARHSVLSRLLNHVNERGWLIIADEASNIQGFENVILAHKADWVSELRNQGYLFVRRR